MPNSTLILLYVTQPILPTIQAHVEEVSLLTVQDFLWRFLLQFPNRLHENGRIVVIVLKKDNHAQEATN